MIDFLEKGRKGMGSTFCAHEGGLDSSGCQRGQPAIHTTWPTKYLLQLLAAAIVPIIIVLMISPCHPTVFRILFLQLKLLLVVMGVNMYDLSEISCCYYYCVILLWRWAF